MQAKSSPQLPPSNSSHEQRPAVELPDHPFWIGTQAHPEFKSRPNRPHPLFRGLVGAAVARSRQRNPHLFDIDLDEAS